MVVGLRLVHFALAIDQMTVVLLINDWLVAFFTGLGPGFAVLSMILVLISWYGHFTVGALYGLECTVFAVGIHFLGGNLSVAVFALLKVMKIISMLIRVIIIGTIAVCAFFDVPPTVA